MEILAGLVAGLVMGLVFLGVAVVKIITTRDINERLQKRLPRSIAPAFAIMIIVIAVPPLLGVAGAVIGLVYLVVDNAFPRPGLGSHNIIFTLAMLGIAAASLLAMAAMRKRLLWLPLSMAIAFAAVFGWVLPLLAGV